MKTLAIVSISLLILGFLFVNWANKPGKVEALKQQRAADALKKMDKQLSDRKVSNKALLPALCWHQIHFFGNHTPAVSS